MYSTKRISLLIAMAASGIGAVAVAATSQAQQSSPAKAPSGTLAFTEREGALHVIDAGRKGTSVGDRVVFSNALLARNDNKRIGTLRVSCVTIQPRTFTQECTGTYFLPGGTIEGQVGLKDARAATKSIAIVGGTGRYAGARGTIASRATSKTLLDDTVSFMP